MKRNEILENAIQTVCHDRSDQYGEPENNFRRVADLWSAYLFPLVLRPQDVIDLVHMMRALASICGYDITSRIHFRDRKTGREWD